MDILATLAERKISEAVRRGEFDNLSLKGRPIPVEDFTDVPEELRLGYKILKNAGVLPEELQLNREMLSLGDLIAGCGDETEREILRKRLSEKRLRYDLLMERNARNAAFHRYAGRVRQRLGL